MTSDKIAFYRMLHAKIIFTNAKTAEANTKTSEGNAAINIKRDCLFSKTASFTKHFI
jgi:hypothetical protein